MFDVISCNRETKNNNERSGLGLTKWLEGLGLDYSMKMRVSLIARDPDSCASQYLLLKLFKIHCHHPFSR